MADLFHSEPEAPSGPVTYVKVAPEQGIDAGGAGLTYAVPAGMAPLEVGQRVIVPLGRGNRQVPGYVIEHVAELDIAPRLVKPIKAVDAGSVTLPGDVIELARWMAAYYCCPLGMVLASVVPAAVKKGTGAIWQQWVQLASVESPADASDASPAADAPAPQVDALPAAGSKRPRLSALQQKALAAATAAAEAGTPWIEIKELADRIGARSVNPIRGLVDKGLLVARKQQAVRAHFDQMLSRADLGPLEMTLHPQQAQAVEKLTAALDAGFNVNLLHGVTGSGKTEVYLRVLAALRERSPQAGVIILVPEIALTPQTAARFVARFADVAILHSALSAAQRHEQWQRIRDGRARIIIGARSAIFAPVADLRLIIVDEEHEPTYKQDQLPRYHARDVAVKRGQLAKATVILGSATPSMESYYNATQRGSYRLIELSERVMGLKLPVVHVTDMTEQRRLRKGVHLMSDHLERVMEHALRTGGQILLLLNRRGYANYIACPDHRCGWQLTCEHCDAAMIYHKDETLPAGGMVRCHHCTAAQLLPRMCPQCNSHKVTTFGLGTQRVEEELLRKFPKLRAQQEAGEAVIARMDSDTMRTAKDYYETLEAFGAGRIRILLGTQMIAKGLDFPNVRVVGVISADTALHMPDFRAAERTFQLIAQVSGRAGRGADPGLVVVQTYSPGDATIELAAQHDFGAFAARELAVRASVGLPPVGRLARIVVRDRDHATCHQRTRKLAQALQEAAARLALPIRLRGPQACPISRIADYHRAEVQILAADAVTIQKLLAAMRNAKLLISDAATAIDVDPQVLS